MNYRWLRPLFESWGLYASELITVICYRLFMMKWHVIWDIWVSNERCEGWSLPGCYMMSTVNYLPTFAWSLHFQSYKVQGGLHDPTLVQNVGSYLPVETTLTSQKTSLLLTHYLFKCGPGISVGIATSYGLDGPGIESRWGGEIFRTCPDRPWGPLSLLYNGYRVFPGGKERPGRHTDPSPPSSAVDHERVELYLYSPYGPYGLYRASVSVQGCTLPLPLPYLFVQTV